MAAHFGHCWEAGGAPAYRPWIQLLRSLMAGDPQYSYRNLERFGFRRSPARANRVPAGPRVA